MNPTNPKDSVLNLKEKPEYRLFRSLHQLSFELSFRPPSPPAVAGDLSTYFAAVIILQNRGVLRFGQGYYSSIASAVLVRRIYLFFVSDAVEGSRALILIVEAEGHVP